VLVFKVVHGPAEQGEVVERLEQIAVKEMPAEIKEGWGLAAGRCIGPEYGPDCRHLYASDGSSQITVFDPITWTHVRTIQVSDSRNPRWGSYGSALNHINELEIVEPSEDYALPGIENYIFAHAFHSDNLSMIDLRTGQVTRSWNLRKLIRSQQKHVEDMKKQSAADLGRDRVKKIKKVRTPNFANSPDPEDVYKHFSTYDWGNNVLNGVAYLKEDDSFLITGKMWNHVYKIEVDYRDAVETDGE